MKVFEYLLHYNLGYTVQILFYRGHRKDWYQAWYLQ